MDQNRDLLEQLYIDFNDRNIDAVLAAMHPDVDWPNDWEGGFLCPCHGSTFDMAGRVFKDKPAPDNLEVPPYMYLSDTRLIIGEDKKA